MKGHMDATVHESFAVFLFPALGAVLCMWFWHSGEMLFTLVVMVASIVIPWKIRRNLRLIDTNFPTNKKNFENCKRAAAIDGWGLVSSIDMVRLEFETSASMSSWGELITVLFTPTGIKINSRPSPRRRFSIASFGRNGKNVQQVIDMLEH